MNNTDILELKKRLKKENSITRIPYDQITSVEETDDYWYLYYGAAHAIIVPKRDIRAQLPELEQILRGRQR